MKREVVATIVERAVESFRYELAEGTIGVPWSTERVRTQLEELRAALIPPELRPIKRHPPEVPSESDEQLWVVAVTNDGFVIFYEPTRREFGLAMQVPRGPAESIHLYGDLVGTFCAR
jgi:hypothetical protein